MPDDWENNYFAQRAAALQALAGGCANHVMQLCSNGGKARQWFNEANGDGFQMLKLKIMHTYMLKNLV